MSKKCKHHIANLMCKYAPLWPNNWLGYTGFMRYLIFLGILFCCTVLKAQKHTLIFYNDSTKKAVQIRRGSTLMVQYKGYLGQEDLTTNTLLSVDDAFIMLGKPRLLNTPKELRQVNLDDITGFRKVSVGSQFLKVLLSAGAIVGTYIAVSNNDHFSKTEQILYSTAAGLGARFALEITFPTKKVKYYLKDGWRLMVR